MINKTLHRKLKIEGQGNTKTKRTNNDLQNITQKTKDRRTRQCKDQKNK
jgi:hypothetical protein